MEMFILFLDNYIRRMVKNMMMHEVVITEEELDKIFLMISRNVRYYRLYNHSKYADDRGRITQERLAELCGVSQSLIANIESEKVKQTFSITVIAMISKVLGVPFEEFFKEHNR